jgi:phenylacetate-CoA ligase
MLGITVPPPVHGTAGLAAHYRLEMTRAGHLDSLTVHVECGGDSADEDSRGRSARELAYHVKSLIGINVGVEVHLPGTLERSVGKAKRLDDRRRS